ncbi:ankyrin repeat domain-containing protein 13C-A-like [Daphnia pulicaria]|uniref:ankyrin repeat domain-containing protein 13C-A-like n=1 Tax=Daphnia pulicaria TaxID=35523 RepID=UPI001EECAF59|nr:ankyrin repeat domain-containing protein 13C-A-like [Daphnia pulicaria]
MADDSSSLFPLHSCVYRNDIRQLSSLLRTTDINQKDKHGNTVLHLAVMLGHKECIHLLLAHNAQVKIKNGLGWNPLAEAISYGDRQTILLLLRKLKQQSKEQLEERRPKLIQALKQMGDFYLQLKWDFQSWVPLVSRILPSDICRIHKKGSKIRVDTTLVDFTDMHWERGDISIVFNGEAERQQSLFILDNKQKVYQQIRYQESESEIEDEVDILMSNDIVAVQMSTRFITFNRAQTGFFFRADKTEMVGPYQAEFFSIGGLVFESRKRREHLTQEDLRKNKALMETLTKGSSSSLTETSNGEPIRRGSLPAPIKTILSWNDYINCSHPPNLGRQLICKDVSKTFRATVAMCQDFPLSKAMLLDVLEVVAPVKHFSKLREFVEMKLPPGFPVKVDIPILPTITTRVNFQDFEFRNNMDNMLFQIPKDYTENPGRFPDL